MSDSRSAPELERYELQTAWAASAPGAVLCSSSATSTPVLEEFSAERGLRLLRHDYSTAAHFYRGSSSSSSISFAAVAGGVS